MWQVNLRKIMEYFGSENFTILTRLVAHQYMAIYTELLTHVLYLTVTWIEHVQVYDKFLIHRLYRDLICSCQAYGAKRWIASLQWMCERFAFSMELTNIPRHELEEVAYSVEGQRNLMKLSHRMIKDFFEMLSMSNNLAFSHVSELNNSGVRVSLRQSNGLGQPKGLIVSAATSLWLPLSPENLFNFFKDDKKRAEWDVLSNGSPVNEVAHISTGTHSGNCLSVIKVTSFLLHYIWRYKAF
ncbi:homeobox-leucine zipper protein HDG11-like [Olea europaea var. sylvestris]|uniref:homeobox-leucine zipper protein HDG11-like n=1 Tax=Olea europaea var. sylvestris TaxID=158386 RepID=UPI000C1CF5D1|nr:homeobox-leucine zipper protein HDG11-like [Olea europaea var. sylvestris]